MELTGKAKDDFIDYLRIKSIEFDSEMDLYPKSFLVENFSRVPFSMQWGVYVDFFDSVGMQIYIKPTPKKFYSVYIDNFGSHLMTDYIFADTRSTARKQAIEWCNEYYNLQHPTPIQVKE